MGRLTVPTYEYRCNECGIFVSVTHTITGTVSLSCSQCKAEMALQIPAASVVFKGEGWAKKDRGAKA
jgi:putative FmdB family regulatory protein